MESPRALEPALKQLRKLYKAIARFQERREGRSQHSSRRVAAVWPTAEASARIFNVRSDAHQKGTTTIAKSAGRVVIENLNVSGMMQNRRLSRALADAGMAGCGL